MATIWMDGRLCPDSEAKVSVLAHTLHYGVGVFEGIRSYEQPDGSAAIFRLDDHLRRLEDSARICGLKLPFSRAKLAAACVEVLEANGLKDGYLRPLVYQDDGKLLGLGANPPTHVAIAAVPWGAYLGEEGLRRGIRVIFSAYRRSGLGASLPKAKICGQYVVSTLAKREAVGMGFDEALLMDDEGCVAEGSGENLFIVRDSVLKTPPTSAPILPGLTRATVLHLARCGAEELGLAEIREENITRGELMIADELFLTGTAAEITPVREVGLQVIGKGEPGPVTRKLQQRFFDVVRGRGSVPAHWRTAFAALAR
ncbi:MAG TPA: branched-chain amino acid transaminase [Planctomycetota bacterium]|nr:branched-chain amino acid transaminase [Planctomycetota bacterium]